MGKRNSQRKGLAMFDSDDTDSVSSTSSLASEIIPPVERLEITKDKLLDDALEALFEKRGATREKALTVLIEAFNSELQHKFVENKCVTLLNQCLNSIRRGSAREIALASHTIGLLALTVGCGDKAHEILNDSVTTISQALKTLSDSLRTSSLLECLAIITFVGRNDLEETERSLQIMWELVHPKLGVNVVAIKPSASLISAVASAWSFLLTTTEGQRPNLKDWLEPITYFSNLLDKDDRAVRVAAGEALALIFHKIGRLGNSFPDCPTEKLTHIQGLRGKVLNQVRDLSVEAAGKGSGKKDLNSQRNLFRDLLEFLEDGYSPETSMKIGSDSLSTSTWPEMIQLNYLKHFLGGAFVKHMQENEFLHEVFDFTPKQKTGNDRHLKANDKKLFRSPNSVVSKARTQHLNKERMQSQGRNAGHFTVGMGEEE